MVLLHNSLIFITVYKNCDVLFILLRENALQIPNTEWHWVWRPFKRFLQFAMSLLSTTVDTSKAMGPWGLLPCERYCRDGRGCWMIIKISGRGRIFICQEWKHVKPAEFLFARHGRERCMTKVLPRGDLLPISAEAIPRNAR